MEPTATQQQYELMSHILNEKQWRLYVGSEAKRLGYGGMSQVSKAAGVSRSTVRQGMREMNSGVDYSSGDRIRKPGGGRKKIAETDATLLGDLEQALCPHGDPMSYLLYTDKSVAHLTKLLRSQGHQIGDSAVRNLLLSLHYSLKPNKKNEEGKSHPDRDQQFGHLNAQCAAFDQAGNPIISIDCKKKEPLGNFKNNGKEWIKRGPLGRERENEIQVNAYDFRSLAEGLAIPYGIYDRLKKQGFVNVGIDHETAAFAVESIRRWWHEQGQNDYPQATALLITADSGGSNAARSRLFKRELQTLANEIDLPITMAHYPPATSKWNVIEHQLFSFISINWRAKPLTSLAVILELISHTTTKSGLTVHTMSDTNSYPIGIKVTDQEMAALNIRRDAFHGEWNYTISPQTTD